MRSRERQGIRDVSSGRGVWAVASILSVVFVSTLAASRPATGQSEPCKDEGACEAAVDFEGRWEGVMTITRAELELDFNVDLLHAPDGSWTGRVVVPAMDWDFPLENVKADGAKLIFGYHSDKGAVTFSGTLVDGSIRGDCVRPTRTIPFTMSRVSSAMAKPPLEVLSGGMKDLAVRFNEDRDKVRLVLLLSPT
jgi:hypothetical protein